MSRLEIDVVDNPGGKKLYTQMERLVEVIEGRRIVD
jgi:hypothetical protein